MNIKNITASIGLGIILLSGCATNQADNLAKENIVTSNEANNQTDPFLWLEEVEGERALNWVRSNNERSLNRLHADSRYQNLENEAMAIVRATDRLTFGSFSNGYVSNFWQDATQIRGIWRRANFQSWKNGAPEWETILDFDVLSRAEGKNWVYKGSDCLNPDDVWNSICLISLSNGGKDANEKREFDVKTKSFISGGFFIPEAKSDITWIDKDNILVATNWGEGTLTESGYPYIVKKLGRGNSLNTATEVFRGTPSDVSAGAYRVYDGTKYHHFFYRNPTFFTSQTFYQKSDGQIVPLSLLPSKHTIVGIKNNLLYVSLQEAMPYNSNGQPQSAKAGSLISIPLNDIVNGNSTQNLKIIYSPQAREALQDVTLIDQGILVEISKNVKSEVRLYGDNANGSNYKTIALPQNGVASVIDAEYGQSEIFFSYNDFITPPSILMAASADQPLQNVQSQPARFNANNLVVEQFEARSKDGTMVPYFVVHRRDMPFNGSTPTLLYGYGGFEVSQLPNYSPYVGKLWLEKGNAYVLANIRGGGEFGPDWHQAGLKTKRQVVYDDFIAVAEDIIHRGITSTRRLGIMGGSNGGLLMGVMLTQRPELFNAVVVQVPLLDMLRYDKLLAGASWVDEYGDPDVPSERPWLEILSPYQNLRLRPNFPEPLFVTSTKDDRVHPGHARKYAAKMESLGMPFLYYENIDGGHSAAANLVEGAKRRAIEFTYLNQKLVD